MDVACSHHTVVAFRARILATHEARLSDLANRSKPVKCSSAAPDLVLSQQRGDQCHHLHELARLTADPALIPTQT